VFGISIGELLLLGAVALMIVGPNRLPKMLGTLGRWIGKLRRITTEVRYQTGIDDILREEGLRGGLNELRGLVRPNAISAIGSLTRPGPKSSRASAASTSKVPTGPGSLLAKPTVDPYADIPHDRTREYPQEGCDAYGCIPDDLWQERSDDDILKPSPLPRSAEAQSAPNPQ
jgi:sec-independent protein translocase protein TatB